MKPKAWKFPYKLAEGISAFKRRGASASSSWILQYKLPGRAKRTIERPGADAKVVANRALVVAGIMAEAKLNPTQARFSAHNRKPLLGDFADEKNPKPGHVDDYREVLVAEGVTKKHADQVCDRITRVVTAAGITVIEEIVPSKIISTIAGLKDERIAKANRETKAEAKFKCLYCGRGHDRGEQRPCMRCAKRLVEGRPVDAEALKDAKVLSPQTQNHYLRAVKQFTAWLAGPERRAKEDLLAHLGSKNPKVDQRHLRQDFGEDGAANLINAALAGPVVLGMSGEDRSWLIEFAVETGFRANEIRTLKNTPKVFRLDEEHPIVVVRAGYSKHREEDHQPIRREFADRLRDYLKGKPAGEQVWDVPEPAIDLIRDDIARAGIAAVDEEGRHADFHALRHTFIMRLVRNPKITVKECQVLARHKDIKTTLNYYGHLRIHDTASAVSRLSPLAKAPTLEKARATGTYDQSAAKAQPASVSQSPLLSLSVKTKEKERASKNGGNALIIEGKSSTSESQLSGLEPETFGSVDRSPSNHNSARLEDVTRAARLRRSRKRSQDESDEPDVSGAIEKITRLIASGRARK